MFDIMIWQLIASIFIISFKEEVILNWGRGSISLYPSWTEPLNNERMVYVNIG